MKIDDVAEDLIISTEIYGCYLLYTNKEYYLYKPENDSFTAVRIDIAESPNDVEDAIINLDVTTESTDKISNNAAINGSLKFLMLHLEVIGLDIEKQYDFLLEVFYDLAEVEFGARDRFKRFIDIEDESIIESIIDISKGVKRSKSEDEVGSLFGAFKNRKGVKKAQRDLGNFLNTECGVVLRKNTHDLYKLDLYSNGYNSTTIDELIEILTGIFGENNLFSTNDVETAVDFISERLTPDYNVVKFSNGIYSMKQHKLVTPENPVFTLIESPYAYNPDAEPEYIQDFLYSSLEKAVLDDSDDSDELTTDEYVTGVLEYIGYLFTSGNSRNILGWITGIGGGGKSTFANIIQAIFGNKCADLDFADIEKDTHSTSILVGNHLNIVREADNGVVYNNKQYKKLVGDEPIPINPKNQHPYMLPKEEVPKSVMVANNIPPFKNPVTSIIQRFLIIEFNHVFRNTDSDIKNLDDLIINSAADMEWLIYNSLEAYKEMVESKKGFKLKLSDAKTKELMYKHSKPLNYLVNKLILKHDATAFDSEVKIYADSVNGETEFTKPYIVTGELNLLIVYLAKMDGVEIPLSEKTGKVDGRLLTKAIKDEFDLHEYYLTTESGGNKNYSSITKRDEKTGDVIRFYPELIKTKLYNETLKSKDFIEFKKEFEKENDSKKDETSKESGKGDNSNSN